MLAFRLAFALFVLAPAAAAASTDWPEFRGPTGQGTSTAANVPLHWTDSQNVAWRTKLPGAGWSSPVLANDRVYLTAAVKDATAKNAMTLHALCLDANSGAIQWDVEVLRPDAAAVRAIHPKNSPASSTPVVRGDRLYLHFGHMGTVALDTAGKILWRQTDLKYPPVHGNGGSPLLTDSALIFSADAADDPFVAALDPATGKLLWKTPRNTPANSRFSFSTPLEITVNGQRQIISAGSGLVAAYDPATGAEIWRVAYGQGYSVVPRPVFAHGLLILSTGYDRATLLAVRPDGARGDATQSAIAWQIKKNAPLTPSPLVVGDEVYTVSDNGFATCADARTGKVHWSQRLGGNFSASPVAAEGRIYFLSESSVCTIVRAATKYEQLAQNDLGQRTLASPAVTDNALFIRTESGLLRIKH
jgi:outer membrane protein assembly factor BamB